VDQAADTGGVDFTIEGRYRTNYVGPVLLTSGNFSTARIPGVPSATFADTFIISDKLQSIRVGLKFATTDDAVDTGVLKEKISAVLLQFE
jgi:hypothetical protein